MGRIRSRARPYIFIVGMALADITNADVQTAAKEGKTSMTIKDDTVSGFLDKLSSSNPTPGGGSASAAAGALGTALTAMVCALTKGRKKYAEYEQRTVEAEQRANELRERFLAAAAKDIKGYDAVSAVFPMPRDTEEQSAARRAAMQSALKGCTLPPFEMMGLACEALELTKSLVGRTNTSAAADLGVAAAELRAAVRGAWLNVVVNTNLIEDRDFAGRYQREGKLLLDRALPLADQIYEEILNSL